ncbi:MAG: hypothetical protein WCO54_11625, partial [Bacteroidota bacterium]
QHGEHKTKIPNGFSHHFLRGKLYVEAFLFLSFQNIFLHDLKVVAKDNPVLQHGEHKTKIPNGFSHHFLY